MSRASIPPMTGDNSNPRLNLSMDALLSKLQNMRFLQEPRFRMYLIDSLISKWFLDSPRELFEIMMKAEYKWRLALHAPYDTENEAMTSSVVGYSERTPGCICPIAWFGIIPPPCPIHNPATAVVVTHTSTNFPIEPQAPSGAREGDPPPTRVSDALDWRHHPDEADAVLNKLTDLMSEQTKKAIQDMLVAHRLRMSASGMVCSCMRKVLKPEDWAAHVSVRIMNYLRNEFKSLDGDGQ